MRAEALEDARRQAEAAPDFGVQGSSRTRRQRERLPQQERLRNPLAPPRIPSFTMTIKATDHGISSSLLSSAQQWMVDAFGELGDAPSLESVRLHLRPSHPPTRADVRSQKLNGADLIQERIPSHVPRASRPLTNLSHLASCSHSEHTDRDQ